MKYGRSAWETLTRLYHSLEMDLTEYIPSFIMVIYTILVASNFFDRIISLFGNWKIFRLETEADDLDGFDPSGLLILQKEKMWLEQGRKVGEHVIPLARNFNGMSTDLESGHTINDNAVEMKVASKDIKGSSSKPSKDDNKTRRYSGSKEAISSKSSKSRKPVENYSFKVSLLEAANSSNTNNSTSAGGIPSSGLASKWASMKQGFQTFKANIEAKKLLPLRQQVEETTLLSRASSSENDLDEIFQRLKRHVDDRGDISSDEDEDGPEIRASRRTR